MLVMASFSAFSQNYEINLTINTRNDTVLLGHFRAGREHMRVNDTVILVNGQGVFRGNRLPAGQYFLASGGRFLFCFLIGDNQQFGIVADTADFNLTQFTSSPDNDVFFEFKRYRDNRIRQQRQLSEQIQNATSDDERNEIHAKWQDLNNEFIGFLEQLINDNGNLYASKVIRTNIPAEVYIPEPPRDADGNITDPNFQWRWWRANFFKNLDIFDPDMLRTEHYEATLMRYITAVIPQHTDSIRVEIDKILTRAQANEEIFRFVLPTIFNHYARRMSEVIREGFVVPENLYIHIAERWWIPYATWSSDEFIENLKERVANTKPTLIGNHAPPIPMMMVLPDDHFRAAALDTAIKFDLQAGNMINDFRRELLNNRYTVLYFWDFTCGHCRTSIQELFRIQQEFKNYGLQAITIQLHLSERQDKGRWIDFVNEQNLFGTGWYNAWSPFTDFQEFRRFYNPLNIVPVAYLLDENGYIVFRNIHPENVRDFISAQTMVRRE